MTEYDGQGVAFHALYLNSPVVMVRAVSEEATHDNGLFIHDLKRKLDLDSSFWAITDNYARYDDNSIRDEATLVKSIKVHVGEMVWLSNFTGDASVHSTLRRPIIRQALFQGLIGVEAPIGVVYQYGVCLNRVMAYDEAHVASAIKVPSLDHLPTWIRNQDRMVFYDELKAMMEYIRAATFRENDRFTKAMLMRRARLVARAISRMNV